MDDSAFVHGLRGDKMDWKDGMDSMEGSCVYTVDSVEDIGLAVARGGQAQEPVDRGLRNDR